MAEGGEGVGRDGELAQHSQRRPRHSRSKNGVASLARSRSKNGVASLAMGGDPVFQSIV